MTKIKLYIACSIDGYIARENNSLDWLHALPNPDNQDYGYNEFIQGIDTVVLGRKTYDEIMGFGVEWPYGNCKTYVVTQNENYQIQTPNTFLLNEVSLKSMDQLKQESKKDIWIVGGGQLITDFLTLGVLDEMMICIIPIILGAGISLFPDKPKETDFTLVNTEAYNTGAVMLTYHKKE